MAHALYMRRAFRDRFGIVNESDGLLEDIEFDTFVGIGMSGTLVAPLLADMGKGDHGFAIVREYESPHSTRTIEGDLNRGDRFIFVDDFIDSGTTLVKVLDAIDNEWGDNPYDQPKMVGAYLYQDHRYYTTRELYEKMSDRFWLVDTSLTVRLANMF